MKPFEVQHPIRGGFGDPRTVSSEQLGLDGPNDPGDYSFHNGIDVSAMVGTPVYPVVSGRAVVVGANEVKVRASRHRVFQYVHIDPAVKSGEQVVADRTVLGTVRFPARHVHLAEIDDGRVVKSASPLAPVYGSDRAGCRVGDVPECQRPTSFESLVGTRGGHCTGIRPASAPRARSLGRISPRTCTGAIESLLSTGRLQWHRTAANFTRTEPPKQDFWRIYGAGTYQNFPAFGDHYYWRTAGNYVFRLTNRPLDTRQFANGRYTFSVTATDLCGNKGVLNEAVQITNTQLPTQREVAQHQQAKAFHGRIEAG